jgi:hypothetical protein
LGIFNDGFLPGEMLYRNAAARANTKRQVRRCFILAKAGKSKPIDNTGKYDGL